MSGLYIHIPFCHSKCIYCDFFSTPRKYDSEAYVDALLNELKQRRAEISEPFSTIYIGGGTPSSLSHDTLNSLLSKLPISEAEEITVEVNPEDVNEQLIDILRKNGVTRVSMGIQSLNDDELKDVGRRHTASRAIDALTSLLEAGFNVSADLIYGLPGQTIESWNTSLLSLLAHRPHHLSCYILSYEPDTPLTRLLNKGKITEADDNTIAEMYSILCRETAAAGYEHYEIANFALPGYHSRHNSAYWRFAPYIGLGPGAHSFDGKIRRLNPHDIERYISSRDLDFTEKEEETAEQLSNDYIMVALRTSEGIDLNYLTTLAGSKRTERVKKTAEKYLDEGKMELTAAGGLRIAEQSWLVGDSLTLDFIEI